MSLKKATAILFLLAGIVTLATGQVVLNEFTASNYDNFNVDGGGWGGEFPDWAEFYNPTGTDVDLGGYFLSDNPSDPEKFEFPAGTIVPANGYLIVICTGAFDATPNQFGYLNTNFKITQSLGESILFSDDNGTLLTQFTYLTDIPTNTMNQSWGRSVDGGDDWVIMQNPSPEAANGGPTGTSYAEQPSISMEAGYYGAPINVTLNTAQTGTTIYYTLDGSIPTDGDIEYTGPINIASTTVLRAIAYHGDPDILPSLVETNTYFFGDDQHTIPVVNISGITLNDGEWNGDELTDIEFFHPDGSFWVESAGDSNEHGNDSNAYDQRGFDYVTRDQLGQDYGLLAELFHVTDRDDFQRVIFKAAANDNYPAGGGGHIRDAYVQTLAQTGGLELDERSDESCILYINGQYWGVYEYREKVDDIDYTEYYYDQPQNFVDYIKTWGGTWEEYGSIDDWNALVTFITTNDMTDPANYDYVTSVYNTNSLIDYMILNSYIVNMDWLNWNTSWWRGRHPDGGAKKWRYALWDMDNTFGEGPNYTGIPDISPGADPCNPEGLGNVGGQGHILVFSALLDNEDFWTDYINRWADLSNTTFSCDHMHTLLDSMIAVIDPEMPGQVERWGGTYDGWVDNVNEIRDFIDGRCADEVISGLEDCYDVEALELTVIIDGIGEVDLGTIEISPEMTPWSGTYFADVNIDLFGDDIGQGLFLYWEVIEGSLVFPDPEDPNQTIVLTDNTTIVAHFVNDLDPVEVMFDVQPAGGGEITMDMNPMGPYPNTTMVDGGFHSFAASEANEWFVFDHWELNNANFNPDEFEAEATSFIVETDTIIAVFNELEHYTVTIDVEPAGAGFIQVDGTEVASYPWTGELAGGVDLNFMTASYDEWTVFSHWQINNHVVTPDEFTPNMIINLNQTDEIIAVYDVIPHHTVTVLIDPPVAGSVLVDETLVVNDSWTGELQGDTPIAFRSTAAPYWELEKWEAFHHSPSPDPTAKDVAFTIQSSDTIIAHFTQEPFAFYVPNAFTPNNDGKNDVFLPVGSAYDPTSYELWIFNRWGDLVFHTTNPKEGWDGSYQGSEYYVEDQVFVYKLKIRSVHEANEKEYSGHLTIYR